MPRIVVDPDDLDALAAALGRARNDLDELGDLYDAYESALGPERVRRGVRHLVSNWSDVQEKFGAELELMFNLVAAAGGEYRALEASLTATAADCEAPDAPGPAGTAPP